MQVTVESTGKLERRMRVELPAERIESEVNSRLQSVGRTVKLKGFRPGKVPPKVVKQRYGKKIREEVLSELMQKSYTDAVMQENLKPAGGPQIQPEEGTDDKSFAYVATFEIMPEVELWYHTDADFVGFRIVRPLQEPSAKEAERYDLDESQKTDMANYAKAKG